MVWRHLRRHLLHGLIIGRLRWHLEHSNSAIMAGSVAHPQLLKLPHCRLEMTGLVGLGHTNACNID